MYKAFTLGAGATLSAKVNYDIEVGLRLRRRGRLHRRRRHVADSADQPVELDRGRRHGIDGSTDGDWVDLTADLSAYTGNVCSASGTSPTAASPSTGFMVDDITITGYPVDGAETDAGWTYAPATAASA